MGWPQYTPSGYPRRKKPGSSQFMRDEFKLIEAGIDRLDLYILQVDFDLPEDEITYRYAVVPYDCTAVRVGYITHHSIAVGGNVQVLWENNAWNNHFELESAASNQLSMGESIHDQPDARQLRNVTGNGEMDEGDWIRYRAYSAIGTQKMQSWVAIERRV